MSPKQTGPITEKDLVEEDPAQTVPPPQILLQDTRTVEQEMPDVPPEKPKKPQPVTEETLVEEDPAQTVPPAQIILQDTRTIQNN